MWCFQLPRKGMELSHYKKTKVRFFKSTLEYILLYKCEPWVMTNAAVKKFDGTYTRMLRRVKNSSWKNRLTNAQLKKRRLALAGPVALHEDPANFLLF